MHAKQPQKNIIEIGSGAYSTVYIDPMNPSAAIKRMEKRLVCSAAREYAISSFINHPNIIKYTKITYIDSHWHLHMPLYQTDLHHFKTRGDSDVIKIAYDITNAVNYLHNNLIIHCDIKPGNILINLGGRGSGSGNSVYGSNYGNNSNNNITATICDFGISVYDSNRPKNHVVQTVNYRAPEINIDDKNQTKYDTSIDIWSLGCIYYYLITHKNLFNPAGEDSRTAICDVLLGSSSSCSSNSSTNINSTNHDQLKKLKNTDILFTIVRKLTPYKITRESRLYFISQLISFCLTPNPEYRSSARTLLDVLYNAISVDYPELNVSISTYPKFKLQKLPFDETTCIQNIPFDLWVRIPQHNLSFAETIYSKVNEIISRWSDEALVTKNTTTLTTTVSTLTTTAEAKLASLYIAHTICGGENPVKSLKKDELYRIVLSVLECL